MAAVVLRRGLMVHVINVAIFFSVFHNFILLLTIFCVRRRTVLDALSSAGILSGPEITDHLLTFLLSYAVRLQISDTLSQPSIATKATIKAAKKQAKI